MNLPLVDQEREFAIGRTTEVELASSFERLRLRLYLALMIGDVRTLALAFLLAGYTISPQHRHNPSCCCWRSC